GLVALGPTPEAVITITAMMVRMAQVLLGTYALGGPHFIT
ncbi:MAG: aldolase, partial [Chloroflexi bacterium]